jgi:hypothetical protein
LEYCVVGLFPEVRLRYARLPFTIEQDRILAFAI